MPVVRMQFTVRLEPTVYTKLKISAKKENRSVSNLIDYLLKKGVDDYEHVNGEIVLSVEDIYGDDI